MFRYGSEILGWSFCVQTQRQWYRTTSSYTGIIFYLNLLLIILIIYILYILDIYNIFIEKNKNRTNRISISNVCIMITMMNDFNFEIQ